MVRKMNEKLLDEVALFVQELLKNNPLKYTIVRDTVMKKFDFGKRKTANILHVLSKRGNFLFLSFGYEMCWHSILYLPEHVSEARKMFRKIKESVPYLIRRANKKTHNYFLSEARKIKLQNAELPADLLVQVIKWKLKVHENLAKRLIGELE